MDLKEFGSLNYLKIENLRNISLVSKELKDGEFVPIVGPNGAGKSTVIDALMLLFNGGQVPNGIIKTGQKEANIEVSTSTGVLIKKRIRINAKNEQVAELVISNKNKVLAKPQVILKDLFGGFYDPSLLATKTGAEVYNTLTAACPIAVEEEKEKEEIKTSLTYYNRKIKELGHMEPVSKPKEAGEYNPEEYVKLKTAVENIAVIEKKQEELHGIINILNDEIKELERHILDKKEQILNYNKLLDSKYSLDEKNVLDTRLLYEKQLAAKEFLENDKLYSKYIEWKEEKEKVDEIILQSNNAISDLDSKIKDLYNNAEFGVPGIKIDTDKNVLINGKLWSNSCFSDRLKTAVMFAMANKDPKKLPLMLIEHGESMSKAKREEIAKLAIEQGFIVFMEIFSENPTGEDGIILTVEEDEGIIEEKKLENFPTPNQEVKSKITEKAPIQPQLFDPLFDVPPVEKKVEKYEGDDIWKNI